MPKFKPFDDEEYRDAQAFIQANCCYCGDLKWLEQVSLEIRRFDDVEVRGVEDAATLVEPFLRALPDPYAKCLKPDTREIPWGETMMSRDSAQALLMDLLLRGTSAETPLLQDESEAKALSDQIMSFCRERTWFFSNMQRDGGGKSGWGVFKDGFVDEGLIFVSEELALIGLIWFLGWD